MITRPPGRRTRWNSRSAAAGSATLRMPKAMETTSADASGRGRAWASPLMHADDVASMTFVEPDRPRRADSRSRQWHFSPRASGSISNVKSIPMTCAGRRRRSQSVQFKLDARTASVRSPVPHATSTTTIGRLQLPPASPPSAASADPSTGCAAGCSGRSSARWRRTSAARAGACRDGVRVAEQGVVPGERFGLRGRHGRAR